MTVADAAEPVHTGVTVASEVALATVTLSVVLGLGRLFANGSFLPSLIVVAVTAHLSAAAVRRSRLTGAAAAGAAVGSGILVLVWVRYWSTTFLGLPTATTLHHAGHDLAQAWHQFGQVVAPAPVTAGFVLAAAIAVWWTAWFSDWAAFRLGAAVEATLPAAAIFLFASMLGSGHHRVTASVAFVAAVLAFVLLHRSDHRARASVWIGTGARDGARSMVALGSGLLVAALAVGAVAGPNLPGSRATPAIAWRGDHGQQSTRITVSPLVDIRKRLVDQSNTVVFTVQSNKRSYWRLTSLDSFDGSVWSSSGRFGRVARSLPQVGSGATGTVTTTAIDQQYDITDLAQIWLPAAFTPKAITIHGTKVRWDSGSDTLIVDTGTATSDDLRYQVTSEQPDLTKAELDHQDGPVPGAIAKQYLGLPSSFPRNVRALAEQVTASGQNPYQRARLLQDYFRQNFTYDLADTPAGHSDQAIEAFLASKRGYCEQFAGTYAAMARAIGLPSRVAVGFTPGQTDPADPDRYIVEGRYAHAWPEVWINQAGWVPFEPTPGRGIPGAESYTGVADQQAPPGVGTATVPTSVPADTPATQPRPNPQATTPQHQVRTVSPAPAPHQGSSAPTDLLWTLAVIVLAALVWVGGLAAVRGWRRQRRRRRAGSAAGRVEVAWIEGVEAVSRLAPAWTPSETKQEFAQGRARSIGAAAEPLDRLADLATAAQWSAVALADDEARQAAELSDAVAVEVRGQLGPARRLRHALAPEAVQSSLWRKRSRNR